MFTYVKTSLTVLVLCFLSVAVVWTDATAPAEKRQVASANKVPLDAASGYKGSVFERRPDGGIGEGISGVLITFTSANGRIRRSVTTDAQGHYQIELAWGAYVVIATHAGYDDYSSAPGFFVVPRRKYQMGNIFLKKNVLTSVLLIRHAEKETIPQQDPPLTPAGEVRAKELIHVAEKAGVKAIYATTALRSQQTVQPLSSHLNVPITNYPVNDFQGLKNMILSDHAGDVVVVAGHSNTVGSIIQAFGGMDNGQNCPVQENEFDNLCLVTIYGPGRVKIVNLQYGAPSP